MNDQNNQMPLLFQHVIEPKAGEVFYHYCSVETFRLICETKTLRFSDINMMNDYAESSWGYGIFEKAATYWLNRTELPAELKGLSKPFFDDIDKIFSKTQFVHHPLLFSLSKRPDVLSQWKAYADDGRGVAIGFSGAALNALPVSILTVEYEEKTQVEEVAQALALMYIAEQEESHSRGKRFREMCFHLAWGRTALKNPAFEEEQEVRCIHMVSVETDDQRPRLVDKGGKLHGTEHLGQPVKFLTRNNGLIAYVDIAMAMNKVAQPIKEVWLGPKNDNALGNTIYMMSANGLKEYVIKRSMASYR